MQRGPSLALTSNPGPATSSSGTPCAQHNGAPRGLCKGDHMQVMSPNPVMKSFQHQHQHQHQHMHRPHHCHSHQFHHHQHEHFPHQGCFQHSHGLAMPAGSQLRHSRSHTMLPELPSEGDPCAGLGVPHPPPPPVARQPGEHQPLLQDDPCRHMAPGCVNSLDRRWRGNHNHNHLRV